MKLNTIDQPDGIWEWWLDGVLIGSYTDVTFRTTALPAGFFGRNYNPIWGGCCNGTAKTRDDAIYIDHMYISGIFLRNAAP